MERHGELRGLNMKHFILTAYVSLGLLLSGCAEPLKCSISWLPSNDTLTGWGYKQFCLHTSMRIYPLDTKTRQIPVRSWEFAVRSLSDPAKKLRFEYKCPVNNGYIGLQFLGSIGMFTAEQVKQLEKLGEGRFECAIILNWVRHSNVVRLKIDHAYTPTNEPAIRLVAIQPMTGDHVTQLGIWFVPQHADPHLTQQVFWQGLTLGIDGVEHRIGTLLFSGSILPLPSGESFQEILPLDGFQPPVPPNRSYKVQAKLLDYQSAVTTIYYDPAIGSAFDNAFKTVVTRQRIFTPSPPSSTP